MTEAHYDLRIIDGRVFWSTFFFSLIAGLNLVSNMLLPVFLSQSIGEGAVGAVSLLWSALYYILNPVLYFIVLYVYCRGPLLSRIARVLISITLASLVGFWIGYICGTSLVAVLFEESAIASLGNMVFTLPMHAIGQLFMAFAVLALSDLVRKWNDALPLEIRNRPGGLIVLVIIYVVLALLNVLAVPLLGIYAMFTVATPFETLMAVMMISVLALALAGQLVLAAGLYLGKKWAWILAVVSSASSTLIDISAIGTILVSGADLSPWLAWMISGLFLGLLVSLTVLSYLMSVSVRLFFGFVNPIKQEQAASAPREFRNE